MIYVQLSFTAHLHFKTGAPVHKDSVILNMKQIPFGKANKKEITFSAHSAEFPVIFYGPTLSNCLFTYPLPVRVEVFKAKIL